MTRETIQDRWPKEATYCWGCGKNNKHGLQLKSYRDDEETVATWEPKEHHLAFPGILNGGIIATLIDCHGTGTANAAAHEDSQEADHDSMFVTSGISVKYLKPTPLDAPVTLRARVKDMGENRITVTCDLYSGDVLCATGEVETARVDVGKFLNK
jgi:acyl-coenzyme A thioesterase PaaI-like protein